MCALEPENFRIWTMIFYFEAKLINILRAGGNQKSQPAPHITPEKGARDGRQ
jgi:hypothetical protein